MQLHEDGGLDVNRRASVYIPELPDTWNDITVLQLLRHASGLPDYRRAPEFSPDTPWTFDALLQLAARNPLHFVPGTDVEQSATNFLLLTEIVERVSGLSYPDFVTKRQIEFLGLGHTGFKEDLGQFHHEDISRTADIHQLFKKDRLYINPTEPAVSYDSSGTPITAAETTALRGFSDIWASAQDISFWDIGLAGSVLIHQPENRALIYAPGIFRREDSTCRIRLAVLPSPGTYGYKGIRPWLFFLPEPLHRRLRAGLRHPHVQQGRGGLHQSGAQDSRAYGDLLSTGYDDNRLYLLEGQFPAAETVSRLESALKDRGIPVFAKFDHGQNAAGAGLFLRPTTVLVFGSPQVGTGLMEEDQSVSLELPLRISVWEDEAGSTWLAFPRLDKVFGEYGLENHPAVPKMQNLLEQLVHIGGSIY